MNNAAYVTTSDVEVRLKRKLNDDELLLCETLVGDAVVLVETCAASANEAVKKLVVCRMVVRALGDGDLMGIPIGATQGSMSALGYTQSWTASGGTGELYISKTEKLMLGRGNRIGSSSPIESGCGH